jgi:cytochrome c553
MPGERTRAGAAVGVSLWLACCALLTASQAVAQPTPPAPATLAVCGSCHGADGNSPSPAIPSIAGQPRVFIENQLVVIREGLRDVPVMKDSVARLSDEEIVALARHYAEQPLKPPAVKVDAAKARRGAELSRKTLCGTCHLPDYAGQQQVPRLAGQHEDYLLLAMKSFRDHPGPGRDTIMAASLYGLKDADLSDLAHYLAAFKPK